MIGLSKVTSAISLLLTLNTEMVECALVKGEVKTKVISFNVRRGSSQQKQRMLQKNRNCPKTYSLLHCDDPSIVYDIPCDWDTCLWDTSFLDPLNPPDVCNAITIADPNAADIPVAVRPCAIWSIMYGEHQSAPPTTSASPVIVPSASPVAAIPVTIPGTKVPVVTMPPTVDGVTYLPDENAYRVSFDTVLINFFVITSFENANQAFATNENNSVLSELNNVTALHLLHFIRDKVDDVKKTLVVSVGTNFSSLSIQQPWKNETILVSETLSGNVIIHEDYGPPRRDAISNMVKEAFQEENSMNDYLMDLQFASNPTLKVIDNLYLGLPSEVTHTTTTIQPSTDKSTSSENEKFVDNIGSHIEWGDWSDTYFIIFVATVGGVVVILLSIMIICCWMRKRAQKRRNDMDTLKTKGSDGTTTIQSPESSKECTENTDTTSLRVIALSPSKTTPMEDSSSKNSKSSEDANVQPVSYFQPKYQPTSGRDDDDDDDDDDIQSDVYSYIDTNTVDDQCYSVAGALMYNPHIPGDDEDQNSVNWSVAGGNITTAMGGGTVLNTSQALNDSVLADPTLQTPQRTNMAQNAGINLSGLVSEDSPSNDNVVIFCDSAVEDDSVSLINDSILQTTLETEQHFEPPVYQSSLNMMSSKSNNTPMSTNARVAAVVAKLEGKTLLSNSFSSDTTATERTTNGGNSNMVSDTGERLKSRHHGSASRGEGTEEGDPSSEESVTLSSYISMPYQNDRNTLTTNKDNTRPPIAARSKSTIDKKSAVTKSKNNGKSVRGKSSFFRSTSAGTTESNNDGTALRNNAWGIPTGESTNEKDNNNADAERKRGFWARSQANRQSKATQMALNGVSSPAGNTAPVTDASSPIETIVSPTTTPNNNNNSNNFLPVQQLKLFEQYEESESDIQSICSYDDRSYFSFVKAAKGSSQLTDQERGSLGAHRPPVTNQQSAYIPSMYKKY